MDTRRLVVERLAKAWLAEAKRLRSVSVCSCGCKELINTRTPRFRPGHDAILLKDYRKRIESIMG